MEQSEVLKRVIGILTEANDMYHRIDEGAERDDVNLGTVTTLLGETMPELQLPDGAVGPRGDAGGDAHYATHHDGTVDARYRDR